MSVDLGCRLELGQLGSAMARLQVEHEEDHAQLLAAETAAVQLQESCNQVDSLRAKQTSLADSITLMQSLLEVCACCTVPVIVLPLAAPCHVPLSAAASFGTSILAPPQCTSAFAHVDKCKLR